MTSYRITEQFSHHNDTPLGDEAINEYECALLRGKDPLEAEIIASNVLQRAGYSVNACGGLTIREVPPCQ